ncbi:Bro-N domain-containing protein [Macrococcoides caseolyticum]|uniref:Phage repressor protein/antirepressor Ant n=1 Tax=Macrococcoides caseolyticum TaxID=69966 RepID=A0ACC9MPZ7_9STAP|nr:Bro-N domain-containing protein [Macrococcus caseolyticus]PKE55485.1 phage repressor protein/antirepressor Ant [Macrococcus caseolyticus]
MNELQVFNFDELPIRTLEVDGEPYFVGKDVADILGYSNSRKALGDHVDLEDKKDGVTIRDTMGRNQQPTLINESGLYALIFSSRLESAKRFKRWVTSEVLPQIRNKGMYITKATATEMINNPEILTMLVEQIAKVSNLQLDYNTQTSNELKEIKQTLTGEYVTPQDITAIKYMVKDKAEKYVDANGTQLTLEDVATADIYELAQHNKRLKEQRRYDIGKAKSKILVATKKHLGMKGNAPNNHIKRRDVDRAIQFIKDMRNSEIA